MGDELDVEDIPLGDDAPADVPLDAPVDGQADEPPAATAVEFDAALAARAADPEEAAAATRVQASMRGRNARAQVAQRKQQKSGAPPLPAASADAEEEAAAATRVQATLRGRNARAQAAQRKQQDAASPLSTDQPNRPSRIAKPPMDDRLARPAQPPSAFASPARPLAPSNSQPAYGGHSPAESHAGAPPSVGGFISEAEHEAHQAKLRKMKKDAEARRKREYEARVVQEEAYRKQIEEEEERQKVLKARREAEARAMRDEQRERFAREREFREQKREELRQRELEQKHHRVKPLFKRREEDAARKEAEEEGRRKAVLMENKKRFVPVEFLEENVKLPGEKESKSYTEMKRAAEEARLDAPGERGLMLPPIGAKPNQQHYRGPARDKVVRELKEQRDKQKIERKQAEERRKNALRFGKLLNEVFNKEPPPPPRDGAQEGDDTASPRKPGSDPTRRKAPPAKTPSPPRAAGGAAGGSKKPQRLDAAFAGAGERPKASAELQERSSRVNQELKVKERQLQGLIAKVPLKAEEIPSPRDLDALLRPRSDLSSAYISAIRSKVELLEDLYEAARSDPASPAHTA